MYELCGETETGGAKRDRTADLLRARQALSQLSYGPFLTGLLCCLLRCACHSFSHIQQYAPSFVPARALPSTKSPALQLYRQAPHDNWQFFLGKGFKCVGYFGT